MKGSAKNDDCYFFYYSSCTKGDRCPFRHESSALGNETVCSYWQQGICSKVHCPFRHMELKKNRSQIPCYWESQPTGCQKLHCPFFHHKSAKESGDDSPPQDEIVIKRVRNENGMDADNTSCTPPPLVQSMVVSINEESDTESIPSPTKPQRNTDDAFKIKSLEELKLEQIQKHDAALYQYDQPSDTKKPAKTRSDLRSRLQTSQPAEVHTSSEKNEFKVKTLEEIRAEKLAKTQSPKENSVNADQTSPSNTTKRMAPQPNKQVRIKRPKLDSNLDSNKPPIQLASHKSEKVSTSSLDTHASAVDTVVDSTETDDYLDGEIEDEEQTNTGSLNDDELLLEIDNILGD